jgi:ABC-type amino acid transport substrate-binding protein
MAHVYALLFALLLLLAPSARAEIPPLLQADAWTRVRERGEGTVTALWNGVDPFVFRSQSGRLVGVEVEVMEAFAAWVRRRHGVRLTVNWVEVPRFEELLPYVARTRQAGVFGWGYFSITDARRQQVRFTPPYMPDLSVLVTNSSVPDLQSDAAAVAQLRQGEAFTMRNTTMADDVAALRQRLGSVPLRFLPNDYDILAQISRQENAFGYLPLSLYIVALQKGLKVKRQPVLTARREGFAGIFPLHSDWQAPVDEFFTSPEFNRLSHGLMRKYLGTRMSELVTEEAAREATDVDLLKLEKEIVTQRFVDAAVRVQQEKIYRNLLVLGAVLVGVFCVALYTRFRANQRFNRTLAGQNELIRRQNEAIELANRRLELKVLQAQLNPHFIFNSLNAIQYFVTLDDRKAALRYITAFSRFLRDLLDGASAGKIAVARECRMLEQYLALEQLRFPHKFQFEVKADTGALEHELPALLVHPFVENALYHGLLNRPDGEGRLDVRFAVEGPDLLVTVTDNGVGRAQARRLRQRKATTDLTPHERLVKDRIALLNAESAAPITLQTTDLTDGGGHGSGTRVQLRLALNGSTPEFS